VEKLGHVVPSDQTAEYRDKNAQFKANGLEGWTKFVGSLEGYIKKEEVDRRTKTLFIVRRRNYSRWREESPSWPQTSRLPAPEREREKALDFHNLLSAAP
jgi:hypothetical protein